jgi:hypothetical protein
VAAGWDKNDNINQSSLYTQDDEDILLEHNSGIKKFTPYINQRVRVTGDVISSDRNEKKILVKKITNIYGDYTQPLRDIYDEFENLISPAA